MHYLPTDHPGALEFRQGGFAIQRPVGCPPEVGNGQLDIPGGEAYTSLAPSRAGCWINMIPAGGQLLIPEGSASCVCQYSLQTSMAFEPIPPDATELSLPILPDIRPAAAQGSPPN